MKTATDITPFMHTMTNSLSTIENQLLEYNNRLSTIETCLYNMLTVSSTPDPSSSPLHNVSLAHEIPSLEEVVITPNEINTTPSSSRRTSTTTTSISPLVFNLPPEKARKVKKMEANDRNQYVRGCMDVFFTPQEMAQSNMGGERKKEKLDEARVDLVKRKLKLLILVDFSM